MLRLKNIFRDFCGKVFMNNRKYINQSIRKHEINVIFCVIRRKLRLFFNSYKRNNRILIRKFRACPA